MRIHTKCDGKPVIVDTNIGDIENDCGEVIGNCYSWRWWRMKIIKVLIKVIEDDFCESDLKEVLEDGFENVGNHTLKGLEVLKWIKIIRQ